MDKAIMLEVILIKHFSRKLMKLSTFMREG